MIIRYLQQEDDLLEISNIYECSWKYAYRDIIPQDYLNSIPKEFLQIQMGKVQRIWRDRFNLFSA